MSLRPIKYLTPVLQPLYRRYLSRTRRARYKNIHILVRPGVFHPGLFISTKLLIKFISQFDLQGKTLLELGAGSGLISLFAASKGAVVTASDINPVAIQNIRDNAKMNGKDLTVIESDLFEKIPNSTFDFIIIAPPYYPKDPRDYAEMAWYCGKNFEYYDRLFQQLPPYYHDLTQVLMILSEDCNIPRIKEIGVVYGFRFDLLMSKRKMFEWNYIFNICRTGRSR
jgi:release factor glutamine methyltransferase